MEPERGLRECPSVKKTLAEGHGLGALNLPEESSSPCPLLPAGWHQNTPKTHQTPFPQGLKIPTPGSAVWPEFLQIEFKPDNSAGVYYRV